MHKHIVSTIQALEFQLWPPIGSEGNIIYYGSMTSLSNKHSKNQKGSFGHVRESKF